MEWNVMKGEWAMRKMAVVFCLVLFSASVAAQSGKPTITRDLAAKVVTIIRYEPSGKGFPALQVAALDYMRGTYDISRIQALRYFETTPFSDIRLGDIENIVALWYAHWGGDMFYTLLRDYLGILSGRDIDMLESIGKKHLAEQRAREAKERVAEEAQAKREEQARLKAEQERLKKEEEERKKQVELFLRERETKVYPLLKTAPLYAKNEKTLYETINAIIDKYGIKDITFTLTDSCLVDYNGKNKHEVNIQGNTTETQFLADIKAAIEKINFETISVQEPYSKVDYPVTSKSGYRIEYKASVDIENLTVIYKRNDLTLVEGNGPFFRTVGEGIKPSLDQHGKYKLRVTGFQKGNVVEVTTSVLKYKKGNRFFTGIEISGLASNIGVRYVAGMSDIGYSCLGWYASIGRSGDGFKEPEFVGGLNLALSKSMLLYGGVGIVSEKAHTETDQNGVARFYSATSATAVEAGLMYRFNSCYISVSYDYVPAPDRGAINLGFGFSF